MPWSSSSVVVGVRQLLILKGPRVTLVRTPFGGGKQASSVPIKDTQKNLKTEPCRICTYRNDDNQILSDEYHHQRHVFVSLLDGSDNEGDWTLCPLCMSLVERLTRLAEELEDIRARIKAVRKITGTPLPSSSQCLGVEGEGQDEEDHDPQQASNNPLSKDEEDNDNNDELSISTQTIHGPCKTEEEEDDMEMFEEASCVGYDDDDDDTSKTTEDEDDEIDVKMTVDTGHQWEEGGTVRNNDGDEKQASLMELEPDHSHREGDQQDPDEEVPTASPTFARVHNTRSPKSSPFQTKTRNVCRSGPHRTRKPHVIKAHTYPYACCGKSYVSRHQYSSHCRQSHKNQNQETRLIVKVLCYFCGRRMNRDSLKVHLGRHTLERAFLCTKCGKDYTESSALKKHSCGATKLKKNQCPVCREVFADSRILIRHMRLKHQTKKVTLPLDCMSKESSDGIAYTCPECGKRFGRKEYLQKHLINMHLLDTMKRYQCPLCFKIFQSPDIFKAHSHPDPNDQKKVIYTCALCDKTYDDWMKYLGHRRSGTHNGVRKQCDACGRLFKWNSELRNHAISCSSSRDEHGKCSVDSCGKMFPTLKERLDHERVVHQGKSSSKCYFCSKTFASTNHLYDHLRTHTHERPFFCLKCGKEFRMNEYLKDHIDQDCGRDEGKREEVRRRRREAVRAFRAKLNYACDRCDKRYGQKPQLVSHKKREHSPCD